MKMIRIEGDVAYVELTKGHEAIIDAVDVPLIKLQSWHIIPSTWGGYYARSGRVGYMHRFILGAHKGQDVDHINNNGLDNRRANLRIGNRSQNMQNRRGANSNNNSTGVRGVHIHYSSNFRTNGNPKTYRNYNARFMVKGKSKTKNFPFTPEGLEAAKAWVEEQRRIHMEFSKE